MLPLTHAGEEYTQMAPGLHIRPTVFEQPPLYPGECQMETLKNTSTPDACGVEFSLQYKYI